MKKNKIPNTFWFRHFLICNRLAQSVTKYKDSNFAKLIKEEEEGRWANEQMTRFFWGADRVVSELHNCDYGQVFVYLEDDELLKQVQKLTAKQLEDYFDKYCVGIYAVE